MTNLGVAMPFRVTSTMLSRTRAVVRAKRPYHTHEESMGFEKSSEHCFFNYTSGRWLWDEASQLQKRRQPFNIQQLQCVAAKSVNANSCARMVKISEGAYNKVFLLTMSNGVEVIARMPNPYLPSRVATASEVATLDFLRNELDVPVPRVLAWSSNKDQPVEAEYIIMEKAPGQELRKSWFSMSIPDKVDIVSQLVKIQAKVYSVDFKHYGSLYYSGETNAHHHIPGISRRFCIGPSSALQFWEGERSFMNQYKGPWSSPVSYAEDVGKREVDWIRRFAKPRNASDPLRQSTSQESPDCHLRLLERYLKIVPQIIPSDQNLCRSTIWHSDLHLGNIFVEKNRIVSIIDWQDCVSVPLFLTCRIPKFLKFNGPLLFDLPPASGLSEEEKRDTFLRYQLTQLQRFYGFKLKSLDNSAFEALSDPHATYRQQLVDFAGSTWEDDGLLFLMETMLQVWRDWDEIAGRTRGRCPITFSGDELSSHEVDLKAWEDFNQLFDGLGIPVDGWVHPEDFKSKAETMQALVTEILGLSDNEEVRRALRTWKLSHPDSTYLTSTVMDI